MKHIQFLRKRRLLDSNLKRGEPVKEKLNEKRGFYYFMIPTISAIVAYFIGFFYFYSELQAHVPLYFKQGKYFFNQPPFAVIPERSWLIFKHSVIYGFTPLILVFLAYFFLPPVFTFFVSLIKDKKIPARNKFSKKPLGYRVLSLITIAVVISFWFDTFFTTKYNFLKFGFRFGNWDLASIILFSIEALIVLLGLLALIFKFMPKNEVKRKPSIASRIKREFGGEQFGLYLGQSTGTLIERQHKAGIAENQAIILGQQDASQNILVLGGLGEGKTTAVIQPLLIQLLDQDCGGLIFDIKGSFSSVVKGFANNMGRDITVIGADKQPMNLLQGLTPETATIYLRSTLTLHGSSQGGDKHWLNAASRLATSVLGILTFIPKHYTLEGFYNFIHDAKFREEIQNQASKLKLDSREERFLTYYTKHYDTAFEGKYEKYKESVKGTIDEVLAGFAHPDVADSFCVTTENAKMPNMFDVLNGTIFLVDMPLNSWGMNGNVIYMLLKLRYFDVVKQRMANQSLNQERPVFFMCDEYQRIVDRSDSQLNSDFNFWDKAREAKNIGIISSQSISSFYSAIGDHTIAAAILQNFRQKICLKTEDRNTIESFEFLLGKAEAPRKSYSQTEGRNKDDKRSSKHEGTTESLSYAKESVVDSQVFRLLEPDEAIASLSIGRRSMDDVIKLYAVR